MSSETNNPPGEGSSVPESNPALQKPPSWLNAQLIGEAVRNAGASAADATVTSMAVTRALAAGENYCSVIYRLVAQTDKKTHHLIVKCAPEDAALRDMVKEGDVFPKESRMFQIVIPEMQRLLGTGPPMSARCLLHRSEPSDVLVLTDLSVEGFRMGDRHGGLDRAHSSLALRALARFHAASYALWRAQPQIYDIFDIDLNGPVGDPVRAMLDGAASSVANEVSSWDYYPPQYGEKVSKLKGKLFPMFAKYINFREGKFNVLLHGDFWVNNMLFKYEGSKVTDVRLVDLQGCHLGSPGVDLLVFKNSSVTEEVYFEHWSGLMREYHSTLAQCMGKLGYGADCPSAEELEAEMLELAPFELCAAFLWLPIIKLQKGRAYDMETAMNEGAKSSMASTYSNPEYKRWLRQLLPVFERSGALDMGDCES